MSEQAKLLLGALTRNVLVYIGGVLVAHGWVTAETATQYTTPELALGIAVFLITVGWSIYQKLRGVVAVKTALKMPTHSSVDEAYAASKAAPVKNALSLILVPFMLASVLLAGSGCGTINGWTQDPAVREEIEQEPTKAR